MYNNSIGVRGGMASKEDRDNGTKILNQDDRKSAENI